MKGVHLLSRLSEDEFLDRESELDRLCGARPSARAGRTAVVLGNPRVGKSELLRKSYDRLFEAQSSVVPLFYSFSQTRMEPARFAADYLAHVLSQFIAFRDGNNRLPVSGESLEAFSKSASPHDYAWVKELVDRFVESRAASDEEAMVRIAVSSPALLEANSGLSMFLLLDNAHLLLHEKMAFCRRELLHSMTSPAAGGLSESRAGSYVLSGLRRPFSRLLPADEALFDSLDVIRLKPISENALEQLIKKRAASLAVSISDSTTELMIQQLRGDLFFIRAIVAAAASTGSSLKTFMEFERVYTDEVLEGRIGGYMDALLREIAPGHDMQRTAIEILGTISEARRPIPVNTIIDRVGDQGAELLVQRLSDYELLELKAGLVTATDEPVLSDYIRHRYRSEVTGRRRPIAGEELLGEKLKHSYRLMMSRYNRAVESQLVQLLTRFDFQNVPAVLFEHDKFADPYDGASRANARRMLDDEQSKIRLAQIVYVSDLGFHERPGATYRLLSASGFDGGIYSETNETQWLIALINSREPVGVDMLDEIDSRMISATGRGTFSTRYALPPSHEAAGQGKIVRWLISKEGFTADALERVVDRGAHSSNYLQLDLLCDYLGKLDEQSSAVRPASQFELVIPIEDDSELIAARTVEQIARAADFDQQAISQIKTALIEACLNAAEHGDSPDRKIYQRFSVTEDRLVITVLNKGNQFAPVDDTVQSTSPGKRGRGLQIIRALMDDCTFERTDDGASLVMTKFLKRTDTQQ
ncbi:MAG: hypothetical protein DMF61_05605 [Blastocatellia bacterium AA13]|nr:MAG: hypothetical protein DMF61_05605 [Blastocatellia bacterium AA13]